MQHGLDLNALCRGHPGQWRLMMELYYDDLVRCAWHVMRNHDDACEVVQDVFVRLWMTRQRLRRVVNFEGYLRVSVRNGARSALRVRRRRRIDPRDFDSTLKRVLVADGDKPYEAIELAERRAMVRCLPACLTPAQRRVFFALADQPGASSRVIAAKLGCSHKNVLATIRRIRRSVDAVVNAF